MEPLLDPAAALEAWTAQNASGAVIHSAVQAAARRKARAASIERLRVRRAQPGPGDER